jgi:hypothetical protein
MADAIITAEITSLIDQFKALLDAKDDLAEQTKRNNTEVIEYRDKLAQAMLDAEIDQVGRHGINWKLKPTTKYSKKAGKDAELFDLLRDHGLGDLIKETVNAQTLQGAMSEFAKENDDELPEEFAEVISVYEYMDISHRKATKSTI